MGHRRTGAEKPINLSSFHSHYLAQMDAKEPQDASAPEAVAPVAWEKGWGGRGATAAVRPVAEAVLPVTEDQVPLPDAQGRPRGTVLARFMHLPLRCQWGSAGSQPEALLVAAGCWRTARILRLVMDKLH